MLNWFFNLFTKDLSKVLSETKTFRFKRTRFIIKKIDVLDHTRGAQVMMQTFDIHKTASAKTPDIQSDKKIREHYVQVLMAGVVHPRLKMKAEDVGILVDDLFVDWDIISKLYSEIMTFTYGKKKMK